MIMEDDEFWTSSNVKAFNFDEEEQQVASHHNATLASILAAKPSNEPFLRPSVILCNGDRIEGLIEFLEKKTASDPPRQDPKDYIRDITEKGVPINFSPYRCKSEKMLLLDCAICCMDGNLITAVTVFISQTLKKSIFLEELKKRPMAFDHYINYLMITGRQREADEISIQS